MPAVEIPVVEVTRDGVQVADDLSDFTPADSSNNHFIAANAGDVEIEVHNDDVSSQTVTIVANPDVFNDGLTLNNLVLTIPAGERWRFGPFRPNTFKQDAGTDNVGRMSLIPSISADLYIRAFKRAQEIN